MADIKVLHVDDDEIMRATLGGALEQYGFRVTTAASVPEALKLISGPETYDVLLSDMHMPGTGDGLTVVSAMRHTNPQAVTVLLSAFPEMNAAAQAILQQADEILVKPMELTALVRVINQRMAAGPQPRPKIETVAQILDRATESTMQDWFARVEAEPTLMSVAMSYEQRCGHLPVFFRELIARLSTDQPLTTTRHRSASAAKHGANRFRQGYTAAMLAEESRILQLSIFHRLQENLANVDYSILLVAVMTIADEIADQLSQSVASYVQQALRSIPIAG
jgi:CheY-like chemotaxis protein